MRVFRVLSLYGFLASLGMTQKWMLGMTKRRARNDHNESQHAASYVLRHDNKREVWNGAMHHACKLFLRLESHQREIEFFATILDGIVPDQDDLFGLWQACLRQIIGRDDR